MGSAVAAMAVGKPLTGVHSKPRFNYGPLTSSQLERLRQVNELYSVAFGARYDDHMQQTGHFGALEILLRTFRHTLSFPIIDLAAGTCELEALLIRPGNGFVRKFRDYVSSNQGRSAIVCVDLNNDKMLERAPKKLEAALRMHGFPSGLVGYDEGQPIRFINHSVEDLVSVAPELVGTMQTVIISYFLHWAVDRTRVMHVAADMLSAGGRLHSIEEVPLFQTVNPSGGEGDTMPPELARAIRENTREIKSVSEWIRVLRSSGLLPILNGVAQQDIDAQPGHIMRLQTMLKPSMRDGTGEEDAA